MSQRDKKNRSSQPADDALFRQAMGDIRPLRDSNRRHQRPAPPAPRPRSLENDEAEIMQNLLDHEIDPDSFATGDELEYRRPGVQDSVIRRLRRGQYSRQAELDLHGNTVREARAELAAFLIACQQHNWRCVRIIHGKGLRSGPGGPVIKGKLANWLRHRDEVLAYCSARANEGGSGAIYVLLRTAR